MGGNTDAAGAPRGRDFSLTRARGDDVSTFDARQQTEGSMMRQTMLLGFGAFSMRRAGWGMRASRMRAVAAGLTSAIAFSLPLSCPCAPARADAKGLDFSIVALLDGDGVLARSGLSQSSTGTFYGTTWLSQTPPGDGTVFRMDASDVITTLHDFQGGPNDPGGPWTEPLEASDGNVYGLTSGFDEGGSLYRITPAGDYAVLHVFDLTKEGYDFESSPVQGPDGLLYFTALAGSTQAYGAVLTSDLQGNVRLLHAFSNYNVGGAYPSGSVTLGKDGSYYGVTLRGGAYGAGTLYRISPQGDFKVLASFDPSTCGNPKFSLVAWKGQFYGVCVTGGEGMGGAIFRADKKGHVEVLHQFGATQGDGLAPFGGLVLVPAKDVLYGTNAQGGAAGYGTIFRVTAKGRYVKVMDFNANTSSVPVGDLVLAQDGFIYGASQQDGQNPDIGTIYRFRP